MNDFSQQTENSRIIEVWLAYRAAARR